MPTCADYGLIPTPDGCRLRVRVSPRAAHTRLLGPHDGALKVTLTAPPVEGAANAALLTVLAEALDVPRSRLILVTGSARRTKTVAICGLTAEAALARLAP